MTKSQNQSTNALNPVLIIGGIALLAVIAVVAIMTLMSDDDSTTTASNDNVADTDNTTIENVTLEELSPLINADEYNMVFLEDSVDHYLLDVRTVEEFDEGHIQNADNISVQTLASRLDEVPSDQPIILYCRSGNRSAQAAEILAEAGYTNVYDLGGVIDWQARGYSLVQ